MKKLDKAHFKLDSDCVKEIEGNLVFLMFLSLVFLARAQKLESEQARILNVRKLVLFALDS